MKYRFLILTLFIAETSFTQWSDKTNLFKDSLHMPVITAGNTQQYPMIINSYPDSGYIVYWEDERSASINLKDIYAQKYDKNGNKLWGTYGKSVANTTRNEHFYSSMNADYRNYSYACTDSANGFYICYISDSTASTTWQRIVVQHLKSDGSKVFSKGIIVAQTSPGNTENYSYPQLVADGNGGFFVSYINNSSTGDNEPWILCYKDLNGVLKFYGGSFALRYYTNVDNECPSQIHNIPLVIQDYMIYPNLQNGCNLVASVNTGMGNEAYLTMFNSVVRVKKDTSFAAEGGGTIKYKKDSVMVYYQPSAHTVNVTCPGGGVGTAYIVDGYGFGITGIGGYSTNYSKGVALPTDGNIVVNAVAATTRRLINNSPTNWFTQLGVVTSEVYTAVPYSFSHSPYHSNFSNDKPAKLDSIVGSITDTVFSNNSPYTYDFSQKTTNGKIYLAAKMNVTSSLNGIYLQAFQLSKKAAHQYQVTYLATNHNGINTGNEVSTGFTGTDITFGNPLLAVDNHGHVIFYVNEVGRAARVSLVINNTQLAWGAMGRRIGSGTTAAGYYNPDMPFAALQATGGTGFIAMTESRGENSTGTDIYGRHLDSLLKTTYLPPLKPVRDLTGGNLQALPETMVGNSKVYSSVEILNTNSSTGKINDNSPCMQILDNHNFGAISTALYQNTGAIRLYNSKPYLNRNYNIYPANTISGASTVTLRLFFSKDDYTALKAAYPSLGSASQLAVIKQTAPYNSAPSTYAPVTGEVKLAVQSAKSVSGGYYIEVKTTNFSGYNNYYIFPAANTPFTAVEEVDSSLSATAANATFIQKLYPTLISNGNSIFIQTGNAHTKSMMVEVITSDGKTVYQQSLNYQSQKIQLPTLESGVFKVRITSGKLLYISSLVKQ